MKVLHLIGAGAYLPWQIGGSIIYCHRLCQNLQALGIGVKVAIHQHPLRKEALGEYIYEGISVRVLPLLPDAMERRSLYSRKTADAIGFRELLGEYKPDLVHFHDFTSVAGITHMRLAKEAGCKIVLTYHTPGNSCSQHKLLYRGKTICDGEILLTRCTECRLSSSGLQPVLSKILANCSGFWLKSEDKSRLSRILTSRRMTGLFRDSWIEMLSLVDIINVYATWLSRVIEINQVPSKKIYASSLGVDNPITNIAPGEKKDNMLKLVFAGRNTKVKGMHLIVEAIKLLPEDLPVKATFFLADTNWEEKEYGVNFENQIKNDKRFEVIYKLPNNQFVNMLSGYDACIVPSIWLETGPLVVLEAFAAGIPVIGSRLGGIVELVREGVDGLLFERESSKELAIIIERLAKDRNALKQMKANIRPPKTMQDLARELMFVYKKCVND